MAATAAGSSSVIERHELLAAGASFDYPQAALQVGHIGGGGEELLVPIDRPQPAQQPLEQAVGFTIVHRSD
jgi:hypothetical protein